MFSTIFLFVIIKVIILFHFSVYGGVMMYFQQKHVQKFMNKYKERARLLISCPDQPGIVAAVTTFCTKRELILWNPVNIRQILRAVRFFYESSSMLRIY